MLTVETITDERVETILDAAVAAEDVEMIDLCETALKAIVQPNLKRQSLDRIAEILDARVAIESDGHIRDCGNGGDDPMDCSPACAKANARASLTRCPDCNTPTHASGSDDDGRCVLCTRAAGVEPITEGA